jgi:hypothetical protein
LEEAYLPYQITHPWIGTAEEEEVWEEYIDDWVLEVSLSSVI